MRTVVRKQSPADISSNRHMGVKLKQPQTRKKVSLFPHSVPIVQRKPLCPCDGGCPRCTGGGVIQPKLIIGAPHDKYEQEADRVADQVMRMTEPKQSLVDSPSSLVQRKAGCSSCGDIDEEQIQTKAFGDQITPLVQRQEEEPEEEEEIQAKSLNNKSPPESLGVDLHSRIQSIRGGGQPLPEPMRTYFEPRFGVDFRNVRVHRGRQAALSAKAINAKAYTVGHDVVFGAGQYAPGTVEGKRLLAHELTHVVQQNHFNANHLNIRRLPKSKDDLEGSEPRYSYSENCGWIDWGHVNPTAAQKLIENVAEASKKMWKKEVPYRTATYHQPELTYEEECPGKYENKEKFRSKKDPGSLDILQHEYGIREYRLGGFQVGKSDPERFDKFNDTIQKNLQEAGEAQDPPFSVPYSIFVEGFSDCLDSDEKNLDLRKQRAKSMITLLLTGYVTKHYPYSTSARTSLNEYISPNSTEEGRRKNRGVLILAIPEFTPEGEEFETPLMASKPKGMLLTAVKSMFKLQRSLEYREQLGVALWIFKNLTNFFETEQIWTEALGHSSFSNEDLPSNLIGFYMAALDKKPGEVRKFVGPICNVYKPYMSKVMFELYEGRWSKTYTFIPSGFENVWPAEFSSIIAIPPNKNLYELIGYEGNTALTWYFEDAEGHRSER